MDAEAFAKLFVEEPLHEDLLPHVVDRTIGRLLHHPLLIGLCEPMLHKQLNAAYLFKKEKSEAALNDREWLRYLMLHERPYRLDALLECVEHGIESDSAAYGEALRRVWTDSENIHQSFDDWIYLWDQSDISGVMEAEEKAALDQMPDVLTIYRGVCFKQAERGMSWSVDRDRAVWFARRFANDCDRKPLLFQGEVARADVWAYLTCRNESEIVVNPDRVVKVEKHPIRS